jgi:hypothetical protein
LRRITAALPAVLLAGIAAPAALAANPVEGYWAFDRGVVEITPAQGVGAFRGVIVRRLTFSTCAHRPGEEMWRMINRSDGTYRGSHVNYTKVGCRTAPGAPALWRVRKEADRDKLDFCANDPGSPPPTDFSGESCRTLDRVGHARDLAQICASGYVRASRVAHKGRDACLVGPSELRTEGCVRTGDGTRHRFQVALRAQQRKGPIDRNARLKSVRFALDGWGVRTDSRGPFKLTLPSSRLSPGGHALRAKLVLKVPQARGAPARRERRELVLDFAACA